VDLWYIRLLRLEQKIAGCVAAAAAVRIGSTSTKTSVLDLEQERQACSTLDSTDSENFQKMTDVLAVSMYTGIAVSPHECFQ
jgi:hypothetical protein